jgi:hypothetical protein
MCIAAGRLTERRICELSQYQPIQQLRQPEVLSEKRERASRQSVSALDHLVMLCHIASSSTTDSTRYHQRRHVNRLLDSPDCELETLQPWVQRRAHQPRLQARLERWVCTWRLVDNKHKGRSKVRTTMKQILLSMSVATPIDANDVRFFASAQRFVGENTKIDPGVTKVQDTQPLQQQQQQQRR